jgi:hypothetical protein
MANDWWFKVNRDNETNKFSLIIKVENIAKSQETCANQMTHLISLHKLINQ